MTIAVDIKKERLVPPTTGTRMSVWLNLSSCAATDRVHAWMA